MEKVFIRDYFERLISCLSGEEAHEDIGNLAMALMNAWEEGRTIYIIGNGGSAGNALHIANDFLYGAGIKNGRGLRVEALPSNTAVLTCLANDVGYDYIFSEQIKVKGTPGDILIALSGSGNSSNIVRAIEVANSMQMITFAILGYDGGKCKKLAHHSVHFKINDMQISEDLQLIVAHICMKWLSQHRLNYDLGTEGKPCLNA